MNKVETNTKLDWHITIFFGLSYLIAWPIAFIFGVDNEAIHITHSPLVATILIYLPKFAFTISGVVLFWHTKQLKEMWTRLTHWHVHWVWYALAYLGPALLYFASAWISNLFMSDQPLSPQFEYSSLPWMLTFGAQTGIFTYFLFRGGLGEEIGLRGYALTRLQTRHSPLRSSLIIGFWWGLWHLPAWIGRSALEIIVVWLGVFAISIIFTLFYNNTMSLPIVMFLHAAMNSFDDVFETIFPKLLELDWELPYVASILIIGTVVAFFINRHSTDKSTNSN